MHPSEYGLIRRYEDSHWWYVGLHEWTVSTLQKKLRDIAAPAIADIGCGTGGLLARLERLYPDAIGIELSPQAFEQVATRKLSNLVRGDITRIPFPDAAFHAVVSNDVICMLTGEKLRDAWNELTRVVRPGGWLMLNLPAYQFLHSSHDTHVGNRTRFTKRDTVAQLRQNGMEIETVSYRVTTLFPAAAAMRVAKRVIRAVDAPASSSDLKLPPEFANRILTAVLRTENRLLSRSFRFPFGLSVSVLARKPVIEMQQKAGATSVNRFADKPAEISDTS